MITEKLVDKGDHKQTMFKGLEKIDPNLMVLILDEYHCFMMNNPKWDKEDFEEFSKRFWEKFKEDYSCT